MLGLLGGLLVLVYVLDRPSWVVTVILIVVEEALLAFLSVFALAVVWCLFTPRWVETLVNRFAGKLVVGSIVLGVGGSVFLVAIEWVRAFR